MSELFVNIPPIALVYVFYGSAFLILGASIASKDMKGSDLTIANSLRLLALFGFTHGIHEWMQLYPLVEGDHLAYGTIFNIKLAALILFVLSYIILLWFGLSLMGALGITSPWLMRVVPVVLLVLWVFRMWYSGFSADLQFIRQASIGARNTFALVGGALAAYGLIAYSRGIRPLSRTTARNLYYAGVSFGFYAFFGGVISSGFTLFRLPLPVELFRGVTAVFITHFIIRALNMFDVETRRKIEQQARRIVQAEKLTSLGQLAAGIAHEINNPLSNASLGIETVRGRLTGNDPEQTALREKLDAVLRNIDKASTIARELLQFSRQRESKFAPVDINSVLRGALTLMQYKLKGISVQQDFAALPLILGDRNKLEQVFINLLSNAVEAMPRGGSISILTMRTDAGVRIRIEDTGIGIPRKNLSRVFDPFFTTKEPGAGTGLGLSICYGIIKEHQGTIDIASAKEKGAAVVVTLPEGGEHAKDTDR